MPEALSVDAMLDTVSRDGKDFKGSVGGIALPTPPSSAGVAEMEEDAVLDIIDIRRSVVEMDLKEDVLSMFNPTNGPRQLPTLLLYNEKGLQLFEDITYLEEYYLTNYEIEILTRYARDIAAMIPSGSMVIELGSGNLRKVCLLLKALEDAGKEIEYYALDLSRTELERTLAQVPPFENVVCRGLLGTYDDGREWLKQPGVVDRPKFILSLGSSIGNFDRSAAASFLGGFADTLGPSDGMLLGVDACANPAKVYHAYNDSEGLTHQFILNGLSHANEVLGSDVFDEKKWKVIGEYVHDDQGGRHQAFYSPREDTVVLGQLIHSWERIQVEQSLKYSAEESSQLWDAAGLTEVAYWSRGNEYGLHLLKKTDMSFDLHPSQYAKSSLPSLQDWESMWAAWDHLTRKMIPDEELLEKPIKLRNASIFYLGHIPTFLDIQLTKMTGEPLTEPANFRDIFERGIDPDVDNPELCHDHSEIPDEWPPVGDIVEYQERVRLRLKNLYGRGDGSLSRDIRRAIWIGFEHEAMHFETLLYMMLQSDRTKPPAVPRPDFEKIAEAARQARVPNQWHAVPEQTITIGMEDPEDGTDPDSHFGWDNEKPLREAKVHAFEAKSRPITNEEYASYLYANKLNKVPASWSDVGRSSSAEESSDGHANGVAPSANGSTNGSVSDSINGVSEAGVSVPADFLEALTVRTVYGPVPLKLALDWPVLASYDELSGCAAWMGGRIPTFEETRSIYTYAEHLNKDEAEKTLGRTVPAVNGHLVNGGVEESPHPPPLAQVDGDVPSDLFIDLEGANVGLRHWHPVPVTGMGDRLAGQSGMGGVWEWTSSPLRRWEGFEPMALYPAYTADFFDEKHNIVLGGSWATHPRIAGRKSFVNWYQRNYVYAWVGARLVRDTP
ncbi:related to TAD2 - tRNA-specific adenosine deaminase 2 [Cephalotrichum gorgonifer]|uniref:Related to TAD2 - tRNA-specific adenosine deaminase 2 n=1 Tax=Cephalotrichum gorgonifer TaxID=2041049 RepID=A0AAE8N645_9PEZI|nr:related to TAD2 - tRNA-specific adenosine deaminase 2 [Cephalotrichum gorgonifer]